MKAPSEKHLEDWIVANPDALGIVERLITRQPRLPSGIPDLVAKFKTGVGPIEIKKGPINHATLVQCLRYIHDIESMAMSIEIDYLYTSVNPGFYPFERLVSGALIGSSIASDDLLTICELKPIHLFTYEFDGHGYTFTQHCGYDDAVHDTLDEWAQGAIGDAIREHVQRWAAARNQKRSEAE